MLRAIAIYGAMATADRTEKFRHSPGIEIVDARRISVTGDDWWTAWKSFYFVEF